MSLAILLAATVGCSSNPLAGAPRTIEPAAAAVSPPASQPPAGAVRPLPAHAAAAVFDAGTRRLAVLAPGSDPAAPGSITVFGEAQAPPRVVDLPGPASALTDDGQGTAYLAARGGYFAVDLSTGHTAQGERERRGPDRVHRGGATRRRPARVGQRRRRRLHPRLPKPGAVSAASVASRNKVFARVDCLATQGDTTVVLDRGQTSVTTIDADGHVQQALRAGRGATTMAADALGRVLVADTRGGQLLVYGVDPLILRQAYPVSQAPYGLAGSRALAWVSQTVSNIVIGYDLSTGIPVEKVRYPTVQQPNSLAFDEASDTLYVVSGSGAGVQVIDHAAGRR
ncbi:hypothetical protein MINTMi198_24410 [Mycobacterium intracellulare M.i.198]|nr:hypothetical protein MINTMi198_24410 [Mycobacterium intracellulare M.i.198]